MEPIEQDANAAGGEGDAAVGGAVVHRDRIAVVADGLAAGEDDVVDVALALVLFFGREDPLIAAQQTALGALQVEERESQPVNRAGGGDAYAVVDHQPALWRLDQRG